MNREQVLPYIGYCVDDALARRSKDEMPTNARLVVWTCGFEPMAVAVWSYLGVRLSDDEAEEIAVDFLEETDWFASADREKQSADFIL